MNRIVVDGIPSVERESYAEPKPPTRARWRPPCDVPEESTAKVVADVVGQTIGSAIDAGVRRVLRALPPLAAVVKVLPLLPALVWHSVRYGLAEPGEQQGGAA
jgi:hypothetical protein